jgi:hypothetical protein
MVRFMMLIFSILVSACGAGHDGGGASTGADAASDRGDAAALGSDGALGSDASARDAAMMRDAGATADAAFVPTDPFTLPTGVTPITFAELATYFASGATSASGGEFTVVTRARDACNAVTSCTAWNDPSPVALMASDGTPLSTPTGGLASLALQTVDAPPSFSIVFAGADVTFDCADIPQTGESSWNCDNRSSANSVVWFAGTYLGSPELSNTTLINWQGVIASDGAYQFVSVLGSQQGTSITGQNNLEQIAIYGQL